MKLPKGDRAIVDLAKLRDYCLDSSHPRGRHKARVFLAALGLSVSDAEILRAALMRAATTEEALQVEADVHGTRYTLDVRFAHRGRSAVVRSHWIVRRDEDVPRLVTCYVA